MSSPRSEESQLGEIKELTSPRQLGEIKDEVGAAMAKLTARATQGEIKDEVGAAMAKLTARAAQAFAQSNAEASGALSRQRLPATSSSSHEMVVPLTTNPDRPQSLRVPRSPHSQALQRETQVSASTTGGENKSAAVQLVSAPYLSRLPDRKSVSETNLRKSLHATLRKSASSSLPSESRRSTHSEGDPGSPLSAGENDGNVSEAPTEQPLYMELKSELDARDERLRDIEILLAQQSSREEELAALLTEAQAGIRTRDSKIQHLEEALHMETALKFDFKVAITEKDTKIRELEEGGKTKLQKVNLKTELVDDRNALICKLEAIAEMDPLDETVSPAKIMARSPDKWIALFHAIGLLQTPSEQMQVRLHQTPSEQMRMHTPLFGQDQKRIQQRTGHQKTPSFAAVDAAPVVQVDTTVAQELSNSSELVDVQSSLPGDARTRTITFGQREQVDTIETQQANVEVRSSVCGDARTRTITFGQAASVDTAVDQEGNVGFRSSITFGQREQVDTVETQQANVEVRSSACGDERTRTNTFGQAASVDTAVDQEVNVGFRSSICEDARTRTMTFGQAPQAHMTAAKGNDVASIDQPAQCIPDDMVSSAGAMVSVPLDIQKSVATPKASPKFSLSLSERASTALSGPSIFHGCMRTSKLPGAPLSPRSREAQRLAPEAGRRVSPSEVVSSYEVPAAMRRLSPPEMFSQSVEVPGAPSRPQRVQVAAPEISSLQVAVATQLPRRVLPPEISSSEVPGASLSGRSSVGVPRSRAMHLESVASGTEDRSGALISWDAAPEVDPPTAQARFVGVASSNQTKTTGACSVPYSTSSLLHPRVFARTQQNVVDVKGDTHASFANNLLRSHDSVGAAISPSVRTIDPMRANPIHPPIMSQYPASPQIMGSPRTSRMQMLSPRSPNFNMRRTL